jgi:amidohydrolase
MHACGHDVHSAIGVGTAQILREMAEDLPGNIRFIFQPEEEEITGALRMIRAGALSAPTPKAIFGLHIAPLPVGQLGWSSDLFLAGFDHYLAILYPQHGTMQPLHLDAIARRCCQVIRSFNKYELPETWDAMEAFWRLMQNPPDSLRNFITYNASLDDEDPEAWHGQFGIGIKAANHHLRRTAIGRIKASLNTICLTTNTHYELEPMSSMLDMRNTTHLVRRSLPALEKTIGARNLTALKAAFPFNCEDFAYYTKHIPGAMYWLGGANPTENKYAILHTPNFDVDERCMITGSASMAALLLNALKEQPFQTQA